MKVTKCYAEDSSVLTDADTHDILAVTSSGLVDFIYVKGIANTANLTNWQIEIDGTASSLNFNFPYLEDFKIKVDNTANFVLISNKKIIFNTSFKVQAVTSGNLTVKYLMFVHENQ